MAGRKKLRRIQFGLESVAGTAVPATAVWRGPGTIEDTRTIEDIDEDIGILGGTDRTTTTKLGGQLGLDAVSANFEQLPYLLAMSFGGPTTGTTIAGTTPSGKQYLTTIPTTVSPTPKFYTIQGGDDIEVEQMEYAYCTQFQLQGTAGGLLQMSGSLAGRQVGRLAAGFTSGIAYPTVEEILTSRGKVYLDPITGTSGTTQVANTIKGFTLTVALTWNANMTMDGNLFFSYPVLTGFTITGNLNFKHVAGTPGAPAGANGEKAAWRAQTPRWLGLRFPGSNLATAGTTYTTKMLAIDLPIKWKKFGALADENGENLVTGDFESQYNITAGSAGSVLVVNEIAALP